MAVEDTLALHVGQIIDGGAKCADCGRDAEWIVFTGADPDPEPVCHEHGAIVVRIMADFMDWRAAKQYGSGAPAATS